MVCNIKKIISTMGKINKYSDYEIASSRDSNYDITFKLEEQFSYCEKKNRDAFEEISFEIVKQRKTLKRELIWIPYNEFDDILYHPISNSSNFHFSAIWKNGGYNDLNGTEGWKVLLKELDGSSHMSQTDLKMIVAEIECNRKKEYSVQVFGITQNPATLNYVIVMDYLFSAN